LPVDACADRQSAGGNAQPGRRIRDRRRASRGPCHPPLDEGHYTPITVAKSLTGVCNISARAIVTAGSQVVNTVMVPCYSDVPRKEDYAFRLGLEFIRN
jgi:hypothetical protein